MSRKLSRLSSSQRDARVRAVRWTSYGNLVFAPHTYTGAFTAKKGHNKSDPNCCQPPFPKSLNTAWAEAALMNASVLVTEWGDGDGPSDFDNIRGVVEQQDAKFTSSTYWDWKQSEQAGCSWSLFKCAVGPDNATVPNGVVDTAKLAVVSRVIPTAVVGTIHSFSYNDTTQVFEMRAAAPGADAEPGVNTLVYVPAHVARQPSEVSVGGAAKLDRVERQPDGSWIIEVAVAAGPGDYTVRLGEPDA